MPRGNESRGGTPAAGAISVAELADGAAPHALPVEQRKPPPTLSASSARPHREHDRDDDRDPGRARSPAPHEVGHPRQGRRPADRGTLLVSSIAARRSSRTGARSTTASAERPVALSGSSALRRTSSRPSCRESARRPPSQCRSRPLLLQTADPEPSTPCCGSALSRRSTW